MNIITNLIVRLAGGSKAIEVLNGEQSKTYAAASGKILTGMAGILGGLAMLATGFIEAKDASGYLMLLKGLVSPANPITAAVIGGWYLILDGKANIGQRAATAKAALVATVTPA